ncbi:MAG: type III pantothenate kinase, partial [Leadbetterella sp.]|nr:type III pantothenate kinase [Leadbetterella sp.]
MTNASIDFGNTRIKIGLFKNQELSDIFRVSTLSETVELLMASSVENAIVASVSLSNEEISEKLKLLKSLVFLDYNTPLPIKNNYETPKTLGYDRIAAAVGANLRFPDQ